MLQLRHLGAACLMAALAAGCASYRASHSQPAVSERMPTANADTANSNFARVVAIDVQRAPAATSGVVGNEVETRRASGERYRITVRFRDGREATYVQNDLNGIRVGDRVRVDGDHLALG